MRAFNTWNFKRSQPSDYDLLVARCTEAIDLRLPIPFVLYWGRGPRTKIGEPEKRSISFIRSLQERIVPIYALGAKFTLVLTDTHAALNGYEEEETTGYFNSVIDYSKHLGFEHRRMSEILSCNLSFPMPSSLSLEEPLAQRLTLSATRHFKGKGTPRQGAAAYYLQNQAERFAIAQEFPSAIFVTFNGKEFRSLFPESMPIFYSYSLCKGCSKKPWFE